MSSVVRSLVSKRKRRTVDKTVPSGAVDLDLTQIHPRVVCMAFPATGLRALYRNAYKDVLHYLDFKFGSNYIVYNLCEESAYRYSAARFHGRVRAFPFRDHHACPLQCMVDFVRDASAYLREHADGVVVIHCKAGKGRTGVLACCLLLSVDATFAQSALEVMAYYGVRRTHDGHGLTVPSQRRCVMYYEQLLRLYHGELPCSCAFAVRLRKLRLLDVPRRLRVTRVRIVCGTASPRPTMTPAAAAATAVHSDGTTMTTTGSCSHSSGSTGVVNTTVACCDAGCRMCSSSSSTTVVVDVRVTGDARRRGRRVTDAAVCNTGSAAATAATTPVSTTTSTTTPTLARAPVTTTTTRSPTPRHASCVDCVVTSGVQDGTEMLTYDLTLCLDHEPRLHCMAGDVRIEFCKHDTLLGALSLHTLFLQPRYTRDDVDVLCHRLYHGERFTVELVYERLPCTSQHCSDGARTVDCSHMATTPT